MSAHCDKEHGGTPPAHGRRGASDGTQPGLEIDLFDDFDDQQQIFRARERNKRRELHDFVLQLQCTGTLPGFEHVSLYLIEQFCHVLSTPEKPPSIIQGSHGAAVYRFPAERHCCIVYNLHDNKKLRRPITIAHLAPGAVWHVYIITTELHEHPIPDHIHKQLMALTCTAGIEITQVPVAGPSHARSAAAAICAFASCDIHPANFGNLLFSPVLWSYALAILGREVEYPDQYHLDLEPPRMLITQAEEQFRELTWTLDALISEKVNLAEECARRLCHEAHSIAHLALRTFDHLPPADMVSLQEDVAECREGIREKAKKRTAAADRHIVSLKVRIADAEQEMSKAQEREATRMKLKKCADRMVQLSGEFGLRAYEYQWELKRWRLDRRRAGISE